MRIEIGPLLLILIILMVVGVRYFIRNKISQSTGTKGTVIYYIIINIIIALLITNILQDFNNAIKFNSSEEAAFIWIMFGWGFIGGWIIVMTLSTIFEFVILTPFVLICNFLFYKIYLNKISLNKDTIINNLELFWKITSPLTILLIAFSYAKNIGILIIFTIQYMIFSLITKKILKTKITKMSASKIL